MFPDARHPPHPGAVGLRARPKSARSWFDPRGGALSTLAQWGCALGGKPERSWFDPRGVARNAVRSGSVANVGVAADSYSAFTWVRFPPDPRQDQRTRPRAPPLVRIRSPRETTKQVKCCGDTPVRHTGVVGFNSHHLLDEARLLRRRRLLASLAQLEVAIAS